MQDIMRVDLTSPDFAWETFETTNTFYRVSYVIAMKSAQVYLFAGFSGANNSNLNDMILLDLPSATLTNLTPNVVYPLARIGASMHPINGNFYLFGGQGLNSFYNDMWEVRDSHCQLDRDQPVREHFCRAQQTLIHQGRCPCDLGP